MGFRENDTTVAAYDVSCGDGEPPAWFAVDEGNVDQDGEVVGAVVIGHGVDQAELLGQRATRVREHGEGKPVLAAHEVALALRLRAYRNQQCVALAELPVKIAPCFKFGNAVRTPAAAKELDDQWAEGQHVCAADHSASGIAQSELGCDRANGQDAVFNTAGEELSDSSLADGHAFRLYKLARVGGYLVELVLKGGHVRVVLRFRAKED